jgi:hypothetical protein
MGYICIYIYIYICVYIYIYIIPALERNRDPRDTIAAPYKLKAFERKCHFCLISNKNRFQTKCRKKEKHNQCLKAVIKSEVKEDRP